LTIEAVIPVHSVSVLYDEVCAVSSSGVCGTHMFGLKSVECNLTESSVSARFTLRSGGTEIYIPAQWLETCGTRTPGGTRRTDWGYEKIILVMTKNTHKKKGDKIKTQN
jgi:hypothetical protein